MSDLHPRRARQHGADDQDVLLVTDGHAAYPVFAGKAGLSHQAVNLRAVSRARGAVHEQDVNAYYSRFRGWLPRFHGVASRYLANYLGWRWILDARRIRSPESFLKATLGGIPTPDEDIANVIVAQMYTLKETAMKNDATTRPQASQPPARLSKGDFVTALRKLLQEEAKAGKPSVDVRAANLHTDVGVYPARGHSMPTCCTVMYEEMLPGDEILLTPSGGKGPTLLVRYKFPR